MELLDIHETGGRTRPHINIFSSNHVLYPEKPWKDQYPELHRNSILSNNEEEDRLTNLHLFYYYDLYEQPYSLHLNGNCEVKVSLARGGF